MVTLVKYSILCRANNQLMAVLPSGADKLAAVRCSFAWMLSDSNIASRVKGTDRESKRKAKELRDTRKPGAGAGKEPVQVHFAVLAGDYRCQQGCIYESEAFHTVRVCKCAFLGQWYYEVVLGSNEPMQIGFASRDFALPSDKAGSGVGDKGTAGISWAYDGSRGRKWYNGYTTYNAEVKWKAGDVVGCLLDLNEQTISFSLK